MRLCGVTLARAHVRSGDGDAIAGYLERAESSTVRLLHSRLPTQIKLFSTTPHLSGRSIGAYRGALRVGMEICAREWRRTNVRKQALANTNRLNSA